MSKSPQPSQPDRNDPADDRRQPPSYPPGGPRHPTPTHPHRPSRFFAVAVTVVCAAVIAGGCFITAAPIADRAVDTSSTAVTLTLALFAVVWLFGIGPFMRPRPKRSPRRTP